MASPVGSKSKSVRVWAGWDVIFDLQENQFLQALYQSEGECHSATHKEAAQYVTLISCRQQNLFSLLLNGFCGAVQSLKLQGISNNAFTLN